MDKNFAMTKAKELLARKYFILGAGIAVIFILLAALFTVGYLLFTGPRMKDQPSIQTYQEQFLQPPGTVFAEGVPELPGTGEVNPLKSTKENLDKGKIYYGYYCTFCHGANGNSQGHVADSFVPRPAILTSSGLGQYSDSQLFRSMLTGTGHDPVLERVVDPEHRWYIVLYVRSFQK